MTQDDISRRNKINDACLSLVNTCLSADPTSESYKVFKHVKQLAGVNIVLKVCLCVWVLVFTIIIVVILCM